MKNREMQNETTEIQLKKIKIVTTIKRKLADIYTPVGIYLRLRDRFRDTILLESTDSHVVENSCSFICINALAGIEIKNTNVLEYKLPARKPEKRNYMPNEKLHEIIKEYMQRFEMESEVPEVAKPAQSLFGYFTFDAIPVLEKNKYKETSHPEIPLARYRLYQYVIAINHYKNEIVLLENKTEGIESEIEIVESLINNKDVPAYPFASVSDEMTFMTDEDYIEMVKKGMQHCYRGDVFQMVLSRRYQQQFRGDEFNVYRALRHINPSPYLFYYDYGDYKLFGSSPEAQLIIKNGKAQLHPIAGTFARSGDDVEDQRRAEALLTDPKENAEHVMLVDLARNDLSRVCNNVQVSRYRQIQYYSHVIHLVSEVTGDVCITDNPFHVLFKTFPAGTLSGAPKHRAIELIQQYEPVSRGYYGGTIGYIGFDGSCNHAIMIRTFLSKENTLTYQAGAGIVAGSKPENELQEVNNKLNALRKAITMAETIN